MQDLKPEFFHKVAEAAILLAERIRETGLCDEVGESVYFQVLSNEWETFRGQTPSIAQLSAQLAKLENDARIEGEKQDAPMYVEDFANDEDVMEFIIRNNNGGREHSHEKYRKLWGVESAEESFILKQLLGSRVSISGSFDFDDADEYRDREARKPKCVKKMEAIRRRFHELEILRDRLSLLADHIEDFICIKKEFYEVIQKHRLEVTENTDKWLEVRSVEEIAAIEPKPIDLGKAIERYVPDELSRDVIEAHSNEDAVALDAIRTLFSQIPDIFFVRARETMSRFEKVKPEAVAFRTWLLEQVEAGIFRSDIMSEIDRRWPDKYSAGARLGKEIFKKLEKNGNFVKTKKQGKVFYVTS